MLIAVVLVAVLAVVSISLLSAARAYVGGESQWSRAQKTATHYLMRYAETRSAKDWDGYLKAIEVPLGDRRAREALDRDELDVAAAWEGFRTGLTHDDDIPGVIRLYRWFRHVPFMSRAIEIWTEGDRHIDELRAEAEALRRAVESGADAAALLPIRHRIHDIDDRLTPLEERFSATLGEAARATYHLLVGTVVFGAILLAGLSIAFSHRVARHEREHSESLRESEARFHRAMIGSSDGFWEWDLTGDRAYYSPQFERLLRMPPGTLLPHIGSVKRLLHVDDIAPARRALSAHLKRGEPYDLVLRLRSADGQWRWMRARGQSQHGPGKVHRMSGSIVDVTDRRHAEQALRESEALFRSLWETTDDAVLIIGADHLIRFANPAAHGLFGHARESLRGKPIALIEPHPSATAGQPPSAIERLIAKGSPNRFWEASEITALHGDGYEFPMEIRFSPLELDGERHFVAFLRDITLRKQAESEIRESSERLEQRVQERTHELSEANRRLLELDRLKSEFLATMSHELRTPLNSILGFTTVLQGGLAGPLNEEQQRQLAFVHGSGQHLLALINDLLDVSRIESGRLKLARRAFDFAEVAEEAMAQLRPLAAKKGLALHVRLSNAVHAWGDRRRVYQILLNLAGNAVKFTEQGSVTIAARCVDDRLEVEVHDTGIGIAAAHIDSLFEPFHQIDGSLARAHEGTGLGLYLSKKLLALMGGTIGVTSRRGHGSCFRFTLPVALPTDSQLAALTALP
jgi:PAS domain S-box-containing protein